MNDYQPYKSYTSYGDVLVAFSALKAGGFQPVLQNINAAQLNMLQALALGGYWIFLPEDEHSAAYDWQDWLKTKAMEPKDVAVPPKYYWGSSIAGSILSGAVLITPVLGVAATINKLKQRAPS